jgi:hypothetical protein
LIETGGEKIFMPKCGDVAAEAFETLMVVAELRAQGELGADFGHLGECAEKLYI